MARGKTLIKQNEVTRILKGIEASGAKGTVEFLLEAGTVKFHMVTQLEVPETNDPGKDTNEWDTIK